MIGIVKPRLRSFARGGVPVHDGHLHVHQNQIERFGKCAHDGLLAVLRLFDLGSAPSQQQADQFPVRVAVIDHQDAMIAEQRRRLWRPPAESP